MIIDTHAHLDMLSNSKAAIDRAFEQNIGAIIVPGVEPETFDKVISYSKDYENIYAQIGVHPSDAKKFDTKISKKVYELAQLEKVVAIGEIGLDYYHDTSFNDIQQSVFKTQLEIAKSLDMPVVVHSRESFEDTFKILEQFEMKKVLWHCYSGSLEGAKMIIKKGWHIAISGVVTFKNAKKIKEVAKDIPLEYIMLETDCPYLAPMPYRGKENEPAYTNFIAKEIANIRDISVREVEKITTNNALKFFNIKENPNGTTV